MIFRTIADESTGATKSIGLLGKTISELKTTIASIKTKGLTNFIFNRSTIDKNAVSNYNIEIEKAIANNATMAEKQQIMKSAMEGTNKATAQLIGSTKGAIVEAEALTAAQHASTLAARTQAAALKAISTAGNMILFAVITKGIELVVKGFDNWIHSAEHCKARVDELMSSYQSALDTANSNAKTVENIASKYEELSKGVNNLGQNISLTTEEYAEYNDIANQIASMFPQLIQGYTDEGTAIISLKGNVEQLRNAYKEAQQEAYNMLVISGKDSDGKDILKNTNTVLNGNIFNASRLKQADFINEIENALQDTQHLSAFFDSLTNRSYEYISWFNDFTGIYDKLSIENLSAEDLSEIGKELQFTKKKYQTEIDNALGNTKIMLEAYLKTDDIYKGLDDESARIASVLANSINAEIAADFKNNPAAVNDYVLTILEAVQNPNIHASLVELFSLNTKDMPVAEAKESAGKCIREIADFFQRDENELRIQLGFEDIDTSYRKLQNSIRQITDDHGISDREELSELQTFTKEFTQPQIELWLEATRGAENAAQAIQIYEVKLSEVQQLSDKTDLLPAAKTLSDLKDLNAELDNLGTAMANLDSEGRFDLGNMDSIADYFLGLEGVSYDVEGVNAALKSLGDQNSTLEEQADAVNTLADQYLTTSKILDHLNEENAELIKFQLERMGISNAEDIVDAALNRTLQSQAEIESVLAQYKSIVTGETLTLVNVTAQELQTLINEGTITNAAANQMALLAIKKQLVNGNTLNTSADINNLISLCKMLGATTTALDVYNKVGKVASLMGMPFDVVESYRKQAEAEVQNSIKIGQSALDNTYSAIPKAEYNGGSAVADLLNDAGSSAKQAQDTYEELFDFFERHVDILNNALELLNANLENVIGSNAKNLLIDAEIGINKESITNYTDALSMYQTKAAEALGKIPADLQNKIINGAVSLTDFVGSGSEDVVI